MLTRVLPCSAGSGPSVDTPQAQASGQPPTVPFAATNEHGQRICRQCGMVGRYKDGKCVEKWGPGPMGPGTVCDRSVALRFPRRARGADVVMTSCALHLSSSLVGVSGRRPARSTFLHGECRSRHVLGHLSTPRTYEFS